jgi:hypothetical protein
MANVLAGGDGIMGGFPLEQWFYEMPVCTRWWMTAALSASVLVQCHVLSPYQLFYSVRTVFFKSQVCSISHAVSKIATDGATVLAADHDLLLLRPAQSRPALPHLLPPTLLPPARRVVRTLPGSLLVATHLRFHPSSLHSAYILHGLPWLSAQQHINLHLEPEEP